MNAKLTGIIYFERYFWIEGVAWACTYVLLGAFRVLGGAYLDAVIHRTEGEIIQTVIHKSSREHASNYDGEPFYLVPAVLTDVLQYFVKGVY